MQANQLAALYDSPFLDICLFRSINSVFWSYNGLLMALINMYLLSTCLTTYNKCLSSPSLHILALAAPSALFLLRGFIVFDKQLGAALPPPNGCFMKCKIILSAHKRKFVCLFHIHSQTILSYNLCNASVFPLTNQPNIPMTSEKYEDTNVIVFLTVSLYFH